jgi:hypothetical protein
MTGEVKRSGEIMTNAAETDLIRIRDTVGSAEFYGVMIAENTTERPHLTQWTELELYRITKGPNTGKYMLRSIGCSVVYHRAFGGCGKGSIETAAKLAEDVRPCTVCRPPDLDDLDDTDQVSMEDTLYKVSLCNGYVDLFTALRSKTDPNTMSGPGMGLMNAAAKVDDKIAAAMNVVNRF